MSEYRIPCQYICRTKVLFPVSLFALGIGVAIRKQQQVFFHIHVCITFLYRIVFHMYVLSYNTIHMYSGITSGRVLNGGALYTKILEVNLFAVAYRLFRRDFSPLDGTYCKMSRRVGRNLYETVCRQMQTN